MLSKHRSNTKPLSFLPLSILLSFSRMQLMYHNFLTMWMQDLAEHQPPTVWQDLPWWQRLDLPSSGSILTFWRDTRADELAPAIIIFYCPEVGRSR